MKHKTALKLIAFVAIPLLSYFYTISHEVVLRSAILLGFPICLYGAWLYFSHKDHPIYLLGDKDIKKDLLEDCVCEDKYKDDSGNIVYDLMFCQLIDVDEDLAYLDKPHTLYFHRSLNPPQQYKGIIVVDDIKKQRHKFPDHQLYTLKDFWTHLQKVGNFK